MEATLEAPKCLCLGPKQSGKSHLLASLQAPLSITNVTHSVPTIGTNIYTIKLTDTLITPLTGPASIAADKAKAAQKSTRRPSKNAKIIVREIGGEMAAMWTNYLSNVTKILYVIDTSNLCQISAAGERKPRNMALSVFRISRMSWPHDSCVYSKYTKFCRRATLYAVGRSTTATHQISASSD